MPTFFTITSFYFNIIEEPLVDAVLISEFGGITSVPLCIHGPTQGGEHSCIGRCNETEANGLGTCSCDPKCVNYGDCCYDYEVFCEAKTTGDSSVSLATVSSHLTNHTSQNTSWTNYLDLIETLDEVLSVEQMKKVLNRNGTASIGRGYDCMRTSLTDFSFYYLFSR